MTTRAAIWLRAAQLPGGTEPVIAVGPDADFSTPADERDRVDREAGHATKVVAELAAAQTRMLRRLIGLSPAGELRFQGVATLERFLASLPCGADDIGDEELSAAWRAAEGARREGDR